MYRRRFRTSARRRSIVVTPPATPPTGLGTITKLPTQPFTVAYGNPSASGSAITAANYGRAGGLVVCGRDQYNHQAFKDISAGGGTVLLYIDAIINASYGRYHDLLINASDYGSAVPNWPGNVPANSTGGLLDFRTTSVMHQPSTTNAAWSKLEAVLELAVAENPHIGGFFADDCGSRSYFPNFRWDTADTFGDPSKTFNSTEQQSYRDGAIKVAQTFRRVADRHGLIVVTNGSWATGALGPRGGGYPDMNQHGCSLFDGGTIEHHAIDAFWTNYATSTQWATAAATNGTAVMLVIASSAQELADWNAAGIVAYTVNQSSSAGYDGVAPWDATKFHTTGLPSHAS